MARKVYISGPMSGFVDSNFPAFNSAAQALRAGGAELPNDRGETGPTARTGA